MSPRPGSTPLGFGQAPASCSVVLFLMELSGTQVLSAGIKPTIHHTLHGRSLMLQLIGWAARTSFFPPPLSFLPLAAEPLSGPAGTSHFLQHHLHHLGVTSTANPTPPRQARLSMHGREILAAQPPATPTSQLSREVNRDGLLPTPTLEELHGMKVQMCKRRARGHCLWPSDVFAERVAPSFS